MNRMIFFYIFFFFFVFVLIPAGLFVLFWGLGKLLGLFLPHAAMIGKQLGLFFSLGLVLCFLFGFIAGWKIVRVRQIDVPFKNLPASFDGYRIAQLSDWHIGTYSRNHRTIEKEVGKVLEAKPDLIVFTGDLINMDPDEVLPFKDLFASLEAPDGVWSIMGNHDYCTFNPDKSPEALARHVAGLQKLERDMGWKMLLNASTVLRRGADSLALIGTENDGAPPFPQYGDLDKAQAGLPDGIFKVLLSHDPTYWRRSVLPGTDIELMLAGHTHAMQFRIGKFSPSMLYFKEWGGLYREGDRKLFVSTGSGGNIPFRFGAWPEVDILTLRSVKGGDKI